MSALVSIVLQKSPRRSCRIKIRNNRIGANGFLNQRCALTPDLESILRARRGKIVLQHNRVVSGHKPDIVSCPLSAPLTDSCTAANHVIVLRQDSSFPLDLNGSTVVIGSAGKDHQVATRDLLLAAHHLTDWSDCIDDGCPRRVGHEALHWF
jgi:hypothetical protein